MKASLLLLVVLVAGTLVAGCQPGSTTPLPTSVPITIRAETLDPGWNITYNKQLMASEENCTWAVVGGQLPTGTELKETGLLTGVPAVMEETGLFQVKVSKGQLTATGTFPFVVRDKVWVTPDVVTVTKFHSGARAEYIISVHNDYSVIEEIKQVTTDNTDIVGTDGFVKVPIPINQHLHDNSVTQIESITSSSAVDSLMIVGYDVVEGTIIVAGFAPLTTRLIKVDYIADATFAVQYDEGTIDVKGWVQINEPVFALAPHETKTVMVAIEMPQGASVPTSQFSFKISAGRATKKVGSVTIQAAMQVTWNITMR